VSNPNLQAATLQTANSDAKDIIDAVERFAEPGMLSGIHGAVDGELIVMQKGQQLVDLLPFIDARASAPRRLKGKSTHTTLDSFIAHTNRFKDDGSAVFASTQSVTTVFDYHRAGEQGQRFSEHRSVYNFPYSEEWKAWQSAFGRSLAQADFATLIEDRIADVSEPSSLGEKMSAIVARLGFVGAGASALLTLSRNAQVSASTRVKNVVNLSTGEAQVCFEESHEGAVKIPGGFVITVPVFTGGQPYQLPVRIRYRLQNGAIAWSLVPFLMNAVLQDAFDGVCAQVRDETGLPVFQGQPES
jgi:hypothetical protein